MRRAAKVDANQKRIVKFLRDLGCSVQPLHAVGSGVPDLLVGYGTRNFLLEVKDGDKPPSARALTEPQVKWHESWRGSVFTVINAEDAIRQMCIPAHGVGE